MGELPICERLREFWCEWTHGGGRIDRDELGRINWRCSKCGRWSRFPVPLKDERSMTDAAIARAREAERKAAGAAIKVGD